MYKGRSILIFYGLFILMIVGISFGFLLDLPEARRTSQHTAFVKFLSTFHEFTQINVPP
jgi:hypothetical protein